METLSDVRSVIADVLGIPPGEVQPSSKSADLPNWDSLHHLIIIMEIEKAFSMRFDLEEVALLDSVEKIEQAVRRRFAPAR